ncbi:glycoside hydrolase family 76 protein [Pedobacter frigiditerrae]|uniref:glycoside hydrolase family 76 protein n=1 Tax=Pedobacter frigiditerrae TaxID=2530452 RepID=UPI001CED120B
MEQYNNPAHPAAGYQAKVASEGRDTRYYDDNQWIGIAAIDVYQRTKRKGYLELAEKTYRLMMTGFDTVSGGFIGARGI